MVIVVISRRFRISLVAVVGALASVLSVSPVGAVTYGDPVANGSSFSEVVVVHIYSESRGEFVAACTGTLISQTEVLTAAHCVRGFSQFQVEVGALTVGSGTMIGVRGSWYSSRYSERKFANDVGLLLLASPANVAAVGRLAPASFKPTKKTSYTLVGYGDDQNGDSGVLRSAKLSVQTSAASRAYSDVFNQKTTLAAGRYRRSERVYAGACSGDSGGPLFTKIKGKRYIAGVTSYGSVDCEANRPSVFARVGYYLKEIKKGRAALSRIAVTPLAPMAVSVASSSSYLYNSFSVAASTDTSTSISRICVTVGGIPATSSDVTSGSYSFGYSPTGGCFTASSLSSTITMTLDFRSSVALSKVVVTVFDGIGRSAAKDFAAEAAAVPLTFSLTTLSTGYSWERRYSVSVPTSTLIGPLKLCVTVDGRAATSSEVEGDITKIPWTPTLGCFSSSSSYTMNGGYIALDKSALVGSRSIVVTLTDSLGRTQSTSFIFTGCTYPYNC